MKRVLYSLLVVGVIVGCSKVTDDGSDVSMNFICSTIETKAVENTTVDDLNNNGIKVVGYASSQSDIYINDISLVQSGSSWELETSVDWPDEGTIDFYAYSPKTYTISTSSTTPLSIAYTVSSSVQDQVDLMIASNIGCSSSDGDVPLEFNHALSCISFAVYGGTSQTIVFNSISVTIQNNDGVLSVDDEGILSWSEPTSSPITYSVPIDSEFTLDNLTTVNDSDGYLKLIPQTLSSEDKLEVDITVGDKNSLLTLNLDGVTWEIGEKYTYTVSVSDKEITFGDVIVNNWVNQQEDNLSESDGIVNLNIYKTTDMLASIVTDFTLFDIKNVSVIGPYYPGAIALQEDYIIDLNSFGSEDSYATNSPYISILENVGRLDLSGITGITDDYVVPSFAFSPGIKGSSTSSNGFEAINTPSLHTVIFSDDIKHVGFAAFAMSGIEEAYYDNIETLGELTFFGSESLKTVSMTNTKMTEIPMGAFAYCTSLNRLILPNIMTFGSSAFMGCTSLTEVNMAKVTSIESGAFYDTHITTVIIPYLSGRGTVEIDNSAFEWSDITHLELLAESIDLGSYDFVSNEDFSNCNIFITNDSNLESDLSLSTINYATFKSVSLVDISTSVVTTIYTDGTTSTEAYSYNTAIGQIEAKTN